MGHPPRIPVLLGYERSVVYFITICVEARRRVLANESAFSAFKEAVAARVEWEIPAAVMMPDHIHLLAAPLSERDARVGNLSAGLKRRMRLILQAD